MVRACVFLVHAGKTSLGVANRFFSFSFVGRTSKNASSTGLNHVNHK